MNFQSSCYCHTTSYTLSINLQFIAPKKKTVSLQNQIHKTIHLFSHNYIMTSAFCCYPVTSCVQFFVTPWFAAPQASLSFAISQTLSKFMFTELVMPSNHLILCCPLLLSIFPSIRVFSNESASDGQCIS